MTDDPLVSIITQVINGIKYLEECIQSVLNQSYPYIEHIFIDGGSVDGTVDVLSSYQAKYPDRIRFVSELDNSANETLNSSTEAWNKGWKMAKGEILGWLGADDRYELDSIQTVVDFFRANPDAFFVFGDNNIINEKGEIVGKRGTWDFNLKKLINEASMASPTSAFYKREVIDKVGFMDTTLMGGSEFDYWIRVGKVFPIHRIDRVFSNFRKHKDSRGSGSKTAARIFLKEDVVVSRRYGGSFFSPIARKYYRFVVTDWLRPVLGFTYPFIKKVLRLKG